MSSELLFNIMLALLFAHELDAVKRHEWRLMPVLNTLSDRVGEQVFIWLHLPAFLVIFWFVASDPNSAYGLFLSGFAVVHVGLHWLFRNRPANEFNNPASWMFIIAAGLFGAFHIISVAG